MNTRSPLIRNLVLIVTLAGIVAVTFGALAQSVEAVPPPAPQEQTAPSVAMNLAYAWRSILQTDDLLIVAHYELPQQDLTAYPIPTPVTTSSAWCTYIADQGGCTSSAGAVDPTDPTSLQYGTQSAWFTVCENTTAQTGCTGEFTNASGTLYSQDRAPRIGDGLAGHYFSPGHGITWNSTAVKACIEPSSDWSTTSTPACTGVTFNGKANTQTAQRAQMQTELVALLVNVQTARGLVANSYTTGSYINAAGRVLVLEAYPYMDQVIPDAFQAAAKQAVRTPYTGTPAGVVALETRIAQTATANGFVTKAGRAGAEWGISGGFWTTLIFMFIGGCAAFAVRKWATSTDGGDSKDANVLAVIAFGAITFLGIFAGGPSLSVVFVTIVILAIPAGWFILSRSPG